MGTFAVGYNVKKAEDLMSNIAKAYSEVNGYIGKEWDNVISTLQREWVGEDEQSYEEEFAKRINTLSENTYELTTSCITSISGLAEAWYKFQQENVLEGGQTAGSGIQIEAPSVAKAEAVSKKERTINANDDRGLRETNSAVTIQSAVEAFVTNIKTKTTGLFEEITPNDAFFGDQTTGIKKYIVKCGEAVAAISTAVKDLNEQLATLAGSSYTTASTTISEETTTASSEVENSLSNLGQTRWQ